MCLVITCEYAGEIDRFVSIGSQHSRRLTSLADRPAWFAAQSMAQHLQATLILNEYSSDLIDVTRSLGHRRLFSKTTRRWSQERRQKLVDLVYRPYRARIRAAIEETLSVHGFVIHLSVRSFNLRSRGKIRRTDAGLLYDPSRRDEVDLCLDWIDAMWDEVPMLKVRRNYPRRGAREGLIQTLRAEYDERDYIGIELWLNRAWVRREVAVRDEAIAGICRSLQAILEFDSEEQVQAA